MNFKRFKLKADAIVWRDELLAHGYWAKIYHGHRGLMWFNGDQKDLIK